MYKIFLPLLMLGLASCSQNNASKAHAGHEAAPVAVAAAADTNATSTQHHHEDAEVLSLNSGKKWKVNKEMMVHLQSIKTLVDNRPADLAGHQQNAKQITAKLDDLTSSCTMKGAAHDELHKWLVPFMEGADSYKEAKTIDEALAQLQALNTSMASFDQYFE